MNFLTIALKGKIFLLAFFLSIIASASAGAPLFEDWTEKSTEGWPYVPEDLARAVLQSNKNSRQFKEQDITGRTGKSTQQLLVWKPIVLSRNPNSRFYFLRPPTWHYYPLLYGAHDYSFWIVDQHHAVLLSATGDGFSVLEKIHNGMHDVEIKREFGGFRYRTLLQFDGRRYNNKSCSTELADGSGGITGCEILSYEEFERRLKKSAVEKSMGK